jgi:hypothetical protein
MKEPTAPREKGTGKAARRVSHRRELAVVTLAAVASVSGVGGLLAAGQHATSTPAASVGTPASSAITAPAQPKTDQGTLAVAQAPRWGDDGDAADGDGQAAFQPANNVELVRRNANVAQSSTSNSSPATVSQGSAPVR